MEETAQLNWQALGEPNYAEVGKWFRLLPPELRNKLNRSEEETLIWTLFYTWLQTRRSGRGRVYASFSQQKTGERFGRSRWTVARALDKLEWMGLLTRLHRRPKPGKVWQTNLYHLTGKMMRTLAAILGKKHAKFPCSKTAPQEFLKNTIRQGDSLSGVAALPEKRLREDDDARRKSFLAFAERIRAKRQGN